MARKARRNPMTIRASDAQRAELASRAERAGLSTGGYILSVVFNTPPPRQSRRPTVDQQALARLSAAVGKIGSNVNQLAYVANSGDWPDSRAIAEAVADVRWMRDTLMQALGITPPGAAEDMPDLAGP